MMRSGYKFNCKYNGVNKRQSNFTTVRRGESGYKFNCKYNGVNKRQSNFTTVRRGEHYRLDVQWRSHTIAV
jgi:hypothetical protein